jgi:acylphosphatase
VKAGPSKDLPGSHAPEAIAAPLRTCQGHAVELAEDGRISAVERSPDGRDRLHAIVHGDVQGVGFRYFVLRRARESGLMGWVRNRADGSVECLAEGPRGALERLLDDLRRGPGLAEVQSVDVDWRPPAGDLRGFEVRG